MLIKYDDGIEVEFKNKQTNKTFCLTMSLAIVIYQ